MIREVSVALAADSDANARLLASASGHHPYHGPPPVVLNDRAQAVTRRDVAAMRRIGPSLSC
jgi:hypothetical protein